MSSSSSSSSPGTKVLVVGSTGATGKHVVRMLLDSSGGDDNNNNNNNTSVVAVVRSKTKLMNLLGMEDTETPPNLFVREVASLSDLSAKDVEELTEGCTAIVSCLGHNLSLRGIYRDGPFVTETTKRLVTAMPASSCRFLLMGSDGVAHPDGVTDPKRSLLERAVIWMIRYLIPPHADNEGAARYLYNNDSTTATAKKWCVVRPGDLTDDDTDPKGYELLDHPRGSLFGGDSTSRMQVAACMVELATMDSSAFDKSYNHKMPVVYTSGCVVNNNNNNNNNEEKEEEETKKAK